MKTRRPNPTADSFAELRRRGELAHRERTARLVEVASPDRVVWHPPVTVLAVDAGREPLTLPADYLFSVAGPAGDLEFVTVRPETVPDVRLERAERIAPTGERGGLRLLVRCPGERPVDVLRFHVADPATFADVLAGADVFVRSPGGDLRPARVSASGIEQADDLYETPPLGCRGRTLLTAFFHAPLAFAFLDVRPEEPCTGGVEVLVLFRDPAAVARLDPAAFRLGCVPMRNRRVTSVHVTVEPTGTYEHVAVPDGQVVVRVGTVQAFRGRGEWVECRPWLGTRYPWKHRPGTTARYVLADHGSDRGPLIGVVEPGRGLDATATHLNVQLVLADPLAAGLPAGAAAVGDRGERARSAVESSRLMRPAAVDPAEVDAEARAGGWLGRGRAGDATAALVALLRQAAGCHAAHASRNPRPAAAGVIDAVRSVRVGRGVTGGPFPVLEVTVELGEGDYERHTAVLFARVLERALPLFAPPLCSTRLTVRTPEGETSWAPRSPAA
jgi:hypothetical protein